MSNDFPSDPSAYRVVTTRWEGTGPIKTMRVEVAATGRALVTWDWTDADGWGPADAMVKGARELDGNTDPDDLTMPSEAAIIAYSLDYAGVTPREPDGTPTGWRNAVLLVEAIERDGGSPYSGLERAGTFHDNNSGCPATAASIRLVAQNLLDSATIGGGAAPTWRVTFHHDQAAPVDDEPEDTSHERDTFVPHPDEEHAAPRPLLDRLDEQHRLLSDLVGLTVDEETTRALNDAFEAITELLATAHGLMTAMQRMAPAAVADEPEDVSRAFRSLAAAVAKWEGR